MKRLLAVVMVLPLTFCSTTPLTKNKLMEGSPVPESRPYTLSKKYGACENFHKYVCSETEDNFKLPDDRSRWTFSFTDIAERLLHAKKAYFKKIEKGYTPKTERGQQVKNVYMACMNEGASAAEEKRIVISEKAIMNQIKSNNEIAYLEHERFLNGRGVYTGFFIESNQKDPLVHDAFVYTDLKTLPERSYYKNKELMKDFKVLLTDFFKTVGMDKPEKRAQMVIDYETALAMKTPLPKELRKRWAEDRNVTKKAFLKKYSDLKMDTFVSRMPANTMIRDFIPEANAYINKSIKKGNLDTLKSVYLFHSLYSKLDDAYPEFFKKGFEFRNKHLGGPKVRSPRQERCTKLAMGQFGMEIDYELLPVLFPNFPQEKVVSIGEKIRSTIIAGVQKNKWLSEEARKGAINKIKYAKLFLVKPDKEENWDFMPIQTYSADKPYENSAHYSKARLEKNLKELAEKKNPARWDMSPLTVNAYYSPSDNKFVLLQGILQPPFFDANASEIENIAAIGVVVGHELGHGIDDQGSKWDYQGKVRQWMKKQDIKAFQSRGNRFVAQFDKIGHDGKLTLGENIGDHVGMTFGYDTAFPNPAKASKEDKQKFFVAYAKMWCSVARPSWEKKRLKTDPHSLGRERINQQVIHQSGFYEAFGCTSKDKMFLSKEKRIRVW